MSFLRKIAGIAAPIAGGVVGGKAGAALGSSIGGAIAGSSKDNRPDSFTTGQSRQGYQTLFDIPKFNQPNNSFVGETLPQALIDAFNTPYFARPTRQLTAADLQDDVFAPRAVLDWQIYNNQQAPMQNKKKVDDAETERLKKLGKQYVQDYMQEGNLNPAYAQTLQNRQFNYADIAKAVMEAIKTPHTNTASHDILKEQGLGLALNAARRVQ